MKLNRKFAALLAVAALLLALFCGCNMRRPSARPPATPVRTLAHTLGPSPAPLTAPKALPSYSPGKTASQDTAGARTTIPEEAAGGQ